MKKLMLLGIFLLNLYGCSEADLEQVTLVDDINSIPKEVVHQDSLSPEMASAIHLISTGANEFGGHMNGYDLKNMSSNSKKEAIAFITDIKASVDSVTLHKITNVDIAVYDTMVEYQHNLSKSIEFMIKYLQSGSMDSLVMQNSYSRDLLQNIRDMKVYAEKYNFD